MNEIWGRVKPGFTFWLAPARKLIPEPTVVDPAELLLAARDADPEKLDEILSPLSSEELKIAEAAANRLARAAYWNYRKKVADERS